MQLLNKKRNHTTFDKFLRFMVVRLLRFKHAHRDCLRYFPVYARTKLVYLPHNSKHSFFYCMHDPADRTRRGRVALHNSQNLSTLQGIFNKRIHNGLKTGIIFLIRKRTGRFVLRFSMPILPDRQPGT